MTQSNQKHASSGSSRKPATAAVAEAPRRKAHEARNGDVDGSARAERAVGHDYVRVPGLLRRWELAEAIDGHADYRVEAAGHTGDGVALFALYRRPDARVLAPARAVPVTLSIGPNEPPFHARILLVENAHPLTAVLVMSDLATEPRALERLAESLRCTLDKVGDRDTGLADSAVVPGTFARMTRDILTMALAKHGGGGLARTAASRAQGVKAGVRARGTTAATAREVRL